MSSANLVAEDDEILQAIILADSFNNRFKPLTLNKPRVGGALLVNADTNPVL
jgi:hypothetical protein